MSKEEAKDLPNAPAARPTNTLLQPIEPLLDDITTDWRPLLDAWRASAAGRKLMAWVDGQVARGEVVFPADVFRALRLTPLSATRVVILGQDPYHGPEQAEGLAFSVPPGQTLPPSLRNIFKELRRSHPQRPALASGHLGAWAQAGVLLLNTSLTVAQARAGSHAGQGWEVLTDQIIQAVAADARPKVFMLWGSHAQSKAPIIEAAGSAHLVLSSNHPSPLSATRPPVPFIGCGHFEKAETYLSKHLGTAWRWPD